MATWEIWLDDASGRRLRVLDKVLEFGLTRVVNAPGAFSVTLPQSFKREWVAPDYMLEFWRNGALLGVGVVQNIVMRDQGGQDLIILSGGDQLVLLDRRIVAYKAGATYASGTDNADDLLKEIVNRNFTSNASDADRSWTANGLTIAADASAAPSMTVSFAYRNVLDLLQDICAASAAAGTELYFDLVPSVQADNTLSFIFTTYTGQPGADHTGNDLVVFSKEWGNLEAPEIEQDYTEFRSVAYGGGQGEGASRYLVEKEDTGLSGLSTWARAEMFVDVRNESAGAAVDSRTLAKLQEMRPRLRFSGYLLDTPAARYGIAWSFGDRVVSEYRGLSFDGLVNAISFSVDNEGAETITARIEVEQ